MIAYALRCEPEGHGFDGWFRSSEDFDAQAARALLTCPACGSGRVAKAVMAPAVAAATRESGGGDEAVRKAAFAKLQAMSRDVRRRADYVGPNFAAEARRIHYGESEARGIYGEASLPEVASLAEEGISALPLLPLPEDKN